MKKEIRTDAFVFRWRKNVAGYQWLKGVGDGKPHLVPRPDRETWIEEYEPPKELFAEFAKLNPTECDIKDFAGKYGDLFDTYTTFSAKTGECDDTRDDMGASLQRWRAEIGEMRVLFNLWEQIQELKIKELEKIIKWKKGRDATLLLYEIKTPTGKRSGVLANSYFSESDITRYRTADALLPARTALQREVNLRLAGHPTIPQLAWTPDHDHRILFKPPHLLAAMWLRFAEAITGEFQLRRCVECGKHFQIGPGGRRTDSITCSNACRQAKYRPE